MQTMLNHLLKMAAQDDETTGLVKTPWYQAMLDLSTADLETAITYGERALAVARNSGQPDLIVQSLNALSSVKMHMGAWEEYEQLATEVHALLRRVWKTGQWKPMLSACLQTRISTVVDCNWESREHAMRSPSAGKSGTSGGRSMRSMI